MANAVPMREEKMDELDVENLIEEIESMGRSQNNQLMNHLSVLTLSNGNTNWILETVAGMKQ